MFFEKEERKKKRKYLEAAQHAEINLKTSLKEAEEILASLRIQIPKNALSRKRERSLTPGLEREMDYKEEQACRLISENLKTNHSVFKNQIKRLGRDLIETPVEYNSVLGALKNKIEQRNSFREKRDKIVISKVQHLQEEILNLNVEGLNFISEKSDLEGKIIEVYSGICETPSVSQIDEENMSSGGIRFSWEGASALSKPYVNQELPVAQGVTLQEICRATTPRIIDHPTMSSWECLDIIFDAPKKPIRPPSGTCDLKIRPSAAFQPYKKK